MLRMYESTLIIYIKSILIESFPGVDFQGGCSIHLLRSDDERWLAGREYL